MIPIQKFRKQKKIAAILEYTPCHTERKAFEQYLLAVRKDNTEKIAYLESFGDSPQRIIRNVCTYERGLLFGYTDKRFDEHGWIRGMLPIVERIELGMLNTIFIGQAVNGMYAIAINWCTGHAGGGRHPSVWDEPPSIKTR